MDKQCCVVVSAVCKLLEAHKQSLSGFQAYLFGSALKPGSAWADVDVLLVIDQVADIPTIMCFLEPVAAQFPLHLTVVTKEESDELGQEAWGKTVKLISWQS